MAEIRTLRSDDYAILHEMEQMIFGRAGYPLVGPYYLRVCTELYADSCFLACIDQRPVGYQLTFLNDRVAYSTRFGVIDEYHGSGIALQLIAATVAMLLEKDVDLVWFTVKPDNLHARRLYRKIGAVERERRHGFFAPGDELLFLEMDRPALQGFQDRYEQGWRREA